MMKNIFQKTAIFLSSLIAADDAQLKKYTKLIDKNLQKREKASPIFRLGNVIFFEIQKASNASDTTYQYRSAAVALPDAYFDMPNESMFQTFSTAIRSNLNALESYIWIKAMIILSTGNPRYLQMPEHAPTWTENEGNLKMIYYRLRSNGMAAETREKCVLTVNVEHQSTHTCQDDVAPE